MGYDALLGRLAARRAQQQLSSLKVPSATANPASASTFTATGRVAAAARAVPHPQLHLRTIPALNARVLVQLGTLPPSPLPGRLSKDGRSVALLGHDRRGAARYRREQRAVPSAHVYDKAGELSGQAVVCVVSGPWACQSFVWRGGVLVLLHAHWAGVGGGV